VQTQCFQVWLGDLLSARRLSSRAGNLPWGCSKEQLADLFQQYGAVEDSFIPLGACRGFEKEALVSGNDLRPVPAPLTTMPDVTELLDSVLCSSRPCVIVGPHGVGVTMSAAMDPTPLNSRTALAIAAA
jgi:hypothetical protein